jgi:hypothetical protein
MSLDERIVRGYPVTSDLGDRISQRLHFHRKKSGRPQISTAA